MIVIPNNFIRLISSTRQVTSYILKNHVAPILTNQSEILNLAIQKCFCLVCLDGLQPLLKSMCAHTFKFNLVSASGDLKFLTQNFILVWIFGLPSENGLAAFTCFSDDKYLRVKVRLAIFASGSGRMARNLHQLIFKLGKSKPFLSKKLDVFRFFYVRPFLKYFHEMLNRFIKISINYKSYLCLLFSIYGSQEYLFLTRRQNIDRVMLVRNF